MPASLLTHAMFCYAIIKDCLRFYTQLAIEFCVVDHNFHGEFSPRVYRIDLEIHRSRKIVMFWKVPPKKVDEIRIACE